MTFTYEHLNIQTAVREQIKNCEGRHTQQAIYSTFHDALTQVCFGCRKIRSTIPVLGEIDQAIELVEKELRG